MIHIRWVCCNYLYYTIGEFQQQFLLLIFRTACDPEAAGMTRASLVFVKVQHSVLEEALAEKTNLPFHWNYIIIGFILQVLFPLYFSFMFFTVFSSCRFKKPKPPQNLGRLRDGFGPARLHSKKGVTSSELVWRKVKNHSSLLYPKYINHRAGRKCSMILRQNNTCTRYNGLFNILTLFI